MNSDETLHDEAAAYALDALDPDERAAFESRLAASPGLRELVRGYRETAGRLARAAGGPRARPELRAMVLERVRREGGGARSRPSRSRWMSLALAAAIGGLLLAVVQSVRLSVRSRTVGALRAELSAVTSRRDLLQRRLDAVLDDHTRMYTMRPTGAGDPALGFGAQVFWRRDTQTWLVHAYNMPRLPAGRVYQLWYVTAQARISAGVFEVDDEGHGIAVLEVPPDARGAIMAAMSIEPGPGGSAQPTGPIVMAGGVE